MSGESIWMKFKRIFKDDRIVPQKIPTELLNLEGEWNSMQGEEKIKKQNSEEERKMKESVFETYRKQCPKANREDPHQPFTIKFLPEPFGEVNEMLKQYFQDFGRFTQMESFESLEDFEAFKRVKEEMIKRQQEIFDKETEIWARIGQENGNKNNHEISET